MKVLTRGPSGEPREVRLTEAEQVVREIHDLLLDQGMSQGEALILLRGARVSEGVRSDTPTLDNILTAEFVGWLTR